MTVSDSSFGLRARRHTRHTTQYQPRHALTGGRHRAPVDYQGTHRAPRTYPFLSFLGIEPGAHTTDRRPFFRPRSTTYHSGNYVTQDKYANVT